MASSSRAAEPSLVFDKLDIDMVVKVLTHTAFGKSRAIDIYEGTD